MLNHHRILVLGDSDLLLGKREAGHFAEDAAGAADVENAENVADRQEGVGSAGNNPRQWDMAYFENEKEDGQGYFVS